MIQRVNIEEAADLVSIALVNPDEFIDKGLGNDLLIQFLRGYPIENLRKLLDHEDERIIRVGLWIASELPGKIEPILEKIKTFSNSNNSKFRYIMLDILACESITELFYCVLESMDDPEIVVQRKEIDIMINLSLDNLKNIYKSIEIRDATSVHKGYLQLLIGEASRDVIDRCLNDKNSISQKYGLIAAARSYGSFSDLVVVAANSENPSVRAEANFLLRASRSG
jgi:hypothetical protein